MKVRNKSWSRMVLLFFWLLSDSSFFSSNWKLSKTGSYRKVGLATLPFKILFCKSFLDMFVVHFLFLTLRFRQKLRVISTNWEQEVIRGVSSGIPSVYSAYEIMYMSSEWAPQIDSFDLFNDMFPFKSAEFLGIDARPYTFSYSELRAATADFNPSNKLGEGGFGPVYKVVYSSIWSPEVNSVSFFAMFGAPVAHRFLK